MLLLGIDTSAAISVGVIRGDQTLTKITRHEPRRHAELVAPLVAQAINDAGIDRTELEGIAVGVGPGPFTGLRIGLVTAQAMGYALNIPVYGVPSMDSLALAARDAGIADELITICDARRGEVYWARYAPNSTTPHAGPDVEKLENLDLSGAVTIGRMAPNPVEVEGIDLLDAQAVNIARLVAQRKEAGQSEFPTQPLYLRRPHVQMADHRKRATPQH